MNIIVMPGRLAGTVHVPASKSAAHRALICAALADAPTMLAISALSRDIEATMHCLIALGADIEHRGDEWCVCPVGRTAGETVLDCGESGSTLRFLLPVAAALGAKVRFTGQGRLPLRPNAALTRALREHGARIDFDAPPMNLDGRLCGGLWALPGDVSSQYVTGLLLALPLLAEDSEIRLTTRLESASYVDMTLQTLDRFGIAVEPVESGWRIPGQQRYRSPGKLRVEGDWSAAAFWLAANALGADIRVEGLREDSAHGDRAMPELLGRREVDASNVPDLVPALAVAAAGDGGVVISGASRLRLKESDRLNSIADMLSALGHAVLITPDGLIINGAAPAPCRCGIRTVNGANDHRIVMAAAVAAAFADCPVRITDAQAVEKSYPGFFSDFIQLGGQVHVEYTGQ